MEEFYLNTRVIKELNVASFPKGEKQYRWLHIVSNGIGQPVYVPIIVARGEEDGPVLGLTAVVHGNELNGISVIQKLFKSIEIDKLKGTIVGVPVVNVPSIIAGGRRFIDGEDLNRIMPGKPNGNVSQVYANRVLNRIVKEFDFLLDLHTASAGRINSYYVRADLSSKMAYHLARLQNPQIILNAPPEDGTLRGAASNLGIDSITIEVGDPSKFQKGVVRSSLTGVYNTLAHLNMYEGELEHLDQSTIICDKSYWIYSDRGGILTVFPDLAEHIKKDDLIAVVKDIFGRKIKEYFAPEDGVVIGKSINPVGQTGSRIIHLGII